MLTPPAALEALLFAAGEPLEKGELLKILGLTEKQLKTTLVALENALEGHGLALIETDREVELRSAPEAAAIVKTLRESELSRDLGKAGLETLAVIAYQQGSSRSEIDWVRGVNSSASVRTLLIRGLIEGEEDPADRRRIRYRLTTEALAHLGAGKVTELPRYAELNRASSEVVAKEGEEI